MGFLLLVVSALFPIFATSYPAFSKVGVEIERRTEAFKAEHIEMKEKLTELLQIKQPRKSSKSIKSVIVISAHL